MKLDERLRAVAELIEAKTHADVGSDHGFLLAHLLRRGRVRLGIAIENKPQPHRNSVIALHGLNAEVRLADGLEGIAVDEVDSLSVCGMGGERMLGILSRFPERIPDRLILQANRRMDLVRQWAYESGFAISAERFIRAGWSYEIAAFSRLESGTDPVYRGLELQLGFQFGPLLLNRCNAPYLEWLRAERERFQGMTSLSPLTACRQRYLPTAIDLLERFSLVRK